jgi:hypothetical protein
LATSTVGLVAGAVKASPAGPVVVPVQPVFELELEFELEQLRPNKLSHKQMPNEINRAVLIKRILSPVQRVAALVILIWLEH